jgi:hypothetical protein
MKSDTNPSQPRAGDEAPEKAIQEDRAAACAMRCAVLDAEILFQEEAVSFESLTPLWNLYCRECAPEQEAEHLGLVRPSEAGGCTLAGREGTAGRLAFHLDGQRVHLPKGDLTLGELLDGFTSHCRDELDIEINDRTKTWAGRCNSVSGRCHHVLIRPRPLLLRPHPESFLLLICQLERYLRRMHGLRLVIHPDLTQSLVNGGVMKSEKG